MRKRRWVTNTKNRNRVKKNTCATRRVLRSVSSRFISRQKLNAETRRTQSSAEKTKQTNHLRNGEPYLSTRSVWTAAALAPLCPGYSRSEERRVGKECRSLWGAE